MHVRSRALPEHGAWRWRCREGGFSCPQRAPHNRPLSVTRISILDPSWLRQVKSIFSWHTRARLFRHYVANTAKFHEFNSCLFLPWYTHHHPESSVFFSVELLLPWPSPCVTQSSQQMNTNVLTSLRYSPAQKPSRAL